MVFLNLKRKKSRPKNKTKYFPPVTVQLPIYNEQYVVSRLITKVCEMNYPRDHLEIQILDDSTDQTINIVDELVKVYKERGFDIKVIRRKNREGFKAGALQNGLRQAKGDFLAIFDADFLPPKDFLVDLIREFEDPKIGAVQARWGHINDHISWFTLAQAIALDGHFILEQRTRAHNKLFITFNGTGGVWRKKTILEAGNWQSDTLTEDLDLSIRSQLLGWQIVYRDDVVVPGELPCDVKSFRIQQSRWAKGTVQTGKKLLSKIFSSRISVFKKFEAFVQLSAHFVYPALLGIAVLSLPLLYLKTNHILPKSYFYMLSLLSVGAFAYPLYYISSQYEVYTNWKKRAFYIPHIIANCMGISLHITISIIKGLLSKGGEFKRTPKYGYYKKSLHPHPNFSNNLLPAAEIIFGLYLLTTSIYALLNLQIFILPFLVLYTFGFIYFGLSSLEFNIAPNFIPSVKRT